MEDRAPVLWIPGQLPGMNDIIRMKLHVFIPPALRGQPFMPARLPNEWNEVKKRWEGIISRLCEEQGFTCPPSGYFNFLCVEENKRRNKDNIGAGAQKIIQDALVKRGSLYNDGWKEILDYRHFFHVDPDRNGVYLVVTENDCMTRAEARLFFARMSTQTSWAVLT